ncbi:uncharacterized protein LOC131219260 [Magnolia sinica]|uniref:uncharacterized protein LOC131219260 n=1 Tax=Magnolia sinica TaxID=86752 RepID=UPI0026592150|nr:uncharacterized protein LOC131219260 [Magnolia sinica]
MARKNGWTAWMHNTYIKVGHRVLGEAGSHRIRSPVSYTNKEELGITNRRSLSLASSSMATPARAEILSLFRSLLRTARSFSNYNIREYARRRTADGFRQNRNLSGPSSISSVFSDGKSQIEVAKRQAIVYSLYAPKAKSVMEITS